MLQVGVDGTDKEINAAEYGAAPEGDDYLVLGHESFGQVAEVGDQVSEFQPGDYVVAVVRRPGSSIYDQIGRADISLDPTYYERGINLLHGYLAEQIVESADFLVKVPPAINHIAVLTEPTSIAAKGLNQAYEAQRRLGFWQPQKTAVLGGGPLGLLVTAALRSQNLEVTMISQSAKPNQSSDLVAQIQARYLSNAKTSLAEIVSQYGPFDFIYEATGYSPIIFEAMLALANNGVLTVTGIPGTGRMSCQIPSDDLMRSFVLGNKLMLGSVSASKADFQSAINYLVKIEALWPGWLSKLLTHPVDGLESYQEMIRLLTEEKSAVKVYVNI
jgi:threonine dehydrogenase-like Zn-dependent dehydrogenase